jgi:hypothetical protein
MKWEMHLSRNGEKSNAKNCLEENPEGKRPQARARHR